MMGVCRVGVFMTGFLCWDFVSCLNLTGSHARVLRLGTRQGGIVVMGVHGRIL